MYFKFKGLVANPNQWIYEWKYYGKTWFDAVLKVYKNIQYIKQGTIIAQYNENALFCFASDWPVLVQYLIVLSAESLSTHL